MKGRPQEADILPTAQNVKLELLAYHRIMP